MTFHDVRLPEKYSRGARGGAGYLTTIVDNKGGFEQRNIERDEPLHAWKIGHLIQTPERMAELVAFFRVRKGRGYAFRFKDWTDFLGTDEPLGTGDGANKDFQLLKAYTDGTYTDYRTITKPVAGTLVVAVDGVPVAVTSTSDTGLVTLTAAPGIGTAVTGSFEFDVPVRFDTDVQQVSYDAPGARSWDGVGLKEPRIET